MSDHTLRPIWTPDDTRQTAIDAAQHRAEPAEAMTPDVDDDKPLPYKRNPDGECLMCSEPAGRPCDPWCLALLPAVQQIAHRDAVLARTLADLPDPDVSYLDRLDGVGQPYRLMADCSLGAGRHRAEVPKRTLRRWLVLAVVGAVLTLGALWFAGHANAETFEVCPSGLTGVATSDTSCAFADNVRRAFYLQPSWTVFAYSPVTQKFYTMQCSRAFTDTSWSDPKRCFGINDAGVALVVYVA